MNNFNESAKIKVFGVGGAGCNAIDRMVEDGVGGVEFYIANTDSQVLKKSTVANKIFLGKETTQGLGAGGNPEVGKMSAIESESEIREAIKDADMVFITAGLGGGTGTGAAPVFAKLAKEAGCLTVGVVTKPFDFEGRKRIKFAQDGLNELKPFVDSLIVVSNNKLLEVIGNIPIGDSFKEADNVLRQGVQTISDLIAVPTVINLDFADVCTVMRNQGYAIFGIGMEQGENKAEKAALSAIQSPLLETQITGAKQAIINVTGGPNTTLNDAQEAVRAIEDAVGNELS
ncbi:MAG: cell division protein FtsZ, partial [Erysipelotrichaceae bacterium]